MAAETIGGVSYLSEDGAVDCVASRRRRGLFQAVLDAGGEDGNVIGRAGAGPSGMSWSSRDL